MALGYPHPDVLMQQMTGRQWLEWIAYMETEPFGAEVETINAGIIACTQANLWRKKGATPLQPRDMMAYYWEGGERYDEKPQAQQVQEKVRAVLGGMVVGADDRGYVVKPKDAAIAQQVPQQGEVIRRTRPIPKRGKNVVRGRRRRRPKRGDDRTP